MLNINRVRKVLRAYNGNPLYRYNTDTNQFEFYNANQQYKDQMTSRLFTNNPYLNNSGLASSKSSSNENTQNFTDENNQQKYNPSKLNLIGAGLDFANSILQQNKRGYYGPNGNITQMGDQLVQQGSNMLALVNPALGLGLKAMNTTGQLLNLVGGGTDGITKFDAWTNTGLGTFLTLGLNGFLGKTSDKFSINRNIQANLGGSYGGTYSFMEDTASKAGKKFGVVSNAQRKEQNRNSAQSIQYQNILAGIDKENQDLKSVATNTYDLNNQRYFNAINGIDFNDIYVTKTGGKLARIKKLNLHKIGGKIKEEWKPIITEEFVPIITEAIDLYERGGKTEELEAPKIEETTQKNVIPEGALHKNKHHMENAENYTQKGIPVIDNDGEQQAEIELNEIIFTLEVTKKLEELYAKYNDYEYSSKEKDEVAIEAGKLLVKEILFNTDDRTGLLKTLKIGGKINGTE